MQRPTLDRRISVRDTTIDVRESVFFSRGTSSTGCGGATVRIAARELRWRASALGATRLHLHMCPLCALPMMCSAVSHALESACTPSPIACCV